jgi:Arc/MetJ-type ribon-helix-helix transcriptional regulator
MAKNATPITISMPNDLKAWLDQRTPRYSNRSETVRDCIARVKAEDEAAVFQPLTSDLIDALSVMVYAWDTQPAIDGRESMGLGRDLVFPAMPGKIKSVEAATQLLRRIKGDPSKQH